VKIDTEYKELQNMYKSCRVALH